METMCIEMYITTVLIIDLLIKKVKYFINLDLVRLHCVSYLHHVVSLDPKPEPQEDFKGYRPH